MKKPNNSLLTDFYELTMANGYLESGMADEIAYFDLFFRRVPDEGGFAIMAGLEQVVDYITALRFDKEDINFLKKKGGFSDAFIDYLENFEFKCDVWAVPEGTPIFPGEPIITVRGPLLQAQYVETMFLLLINHQTLIATKANRIVRAAEGRGVMEFGTRRAHGSSAAILGARAAYIGGCVGTACTVCERDMGILALGTMAHSWVQVFESEYEAFSTYAKLYPDNCTLLVDTFSVLGSGVPNAIRVFKEQGIKKPAIRIDSGDAAYLTKKSRKMLDEAGFPNCKIVVSNSLDEWLIRDILMQGAQIDSFGVGERLITSKSDPVFGGVYKLAAVENDDGIMPKIKISENPAKMTNPHFKRVYRLFDRENGKAIADYITLHDEVVDDGAPLELFDPVSTWKRKRIENFQAVELLVPIFLGGKLVYQVPDIEASRSYCLAQVDTLWDEVKRFENPHNYYVDVSQKLWDLKQNMLKHAQ